MKVGEDGTSYSKSLLFISAISMHKVVDGNQPLCVGSNTAYCSIIFAKRTEIIAFIKCFKSTLNKNIIFMSTESYIVTTHANKKPTS